MTLPTDQKVGGSSPSERAKQVRRSEPLTGSANPFTVSLSPNPLSWDEKVFVRAARDEVRLQTTE